MKLRLRFECDVDVGIAGAAVADLKPKSASNVNFHKEEFPEAVELEKMPDTLASMGSSKKANQLLMGFALETDDGIESAG